MDRIVELGRLMDYYGMLLTERQRELIKQAAYEDCSLSEIAEREGMSRQGVRDALLHGEHQLRLFEASLHLVERNDRMRKAASEAKDFIAGLQLENSEKEQLLSKISALTEAWEEDDGI